VYPYVPSGRAGPIRDLVVAVARATGRVDLIEFGTRESPKESAVVEGDTERLRAGIRVAPGDLEFGANETVRRCSGGRRC
jgi:hypothetical protein